MKEKQSAAWNRRLPLRVHRNAVRRTLAQTIIQTRQQVRDGFFGFVAHVGEAEGLALDFAVAAVDDEVMFFAEISHELGNVDVPVVFDAGKSDRAKIFFGEKVEAVGANPIVNQCVSPGMTFKTFRQGFAENFIKL